MLAAIVLCTAPLRGDTFTTYHFAIDSFFVAGIDDAGDVLIERPTGNSATQYEIFTAGLLVYESTALPSFFVEDNGTPCAPPTLPVGDRATNESVCNGDRQVYEALIGGSNFSSLFEIYPGSAPLGVTAAPSGDQAQLVVNPDGDYAFVEEVNGGPIGADIEEVTVTPEPSSSVLLGTGLLGLWFAAIRRRRL